MLRTKLVCTIGPVSVDRVDELAAAGMDVARINFSHGSAEDHARSAAAVRRASAAAGRPIAVLADLPGPKVRMGQLAEGEIVLKHGATFELRRDPSPGDAHSAPVSYPDLCDDVRAGDRILLADGAVTLEVIDTGESIKTVVVHGGRVRSRAGINVPSERLSLPALTEADHLGVKEALEIGVDLVAQSFVRRADDVSALRRLLGDSNIGIIAKIETRPAVEAFESICHCSDGVMVARGDLGVELAFEEIPVIQKQLLRKALKIGVPSVVATQMLESMTKAARPTRAEASDVANAVLDGADAIMLSAETAVGEFPIEAARAAHLIAAAAQSQGGDPPSNPAGLATDAEDVARAAAVLIRGDIRATAVACFTRTGKTAQLLSQIRPTIPVYAYSSRPEIVSRLAINYAVVPRHMEPPTNTDEMISLLDKCLRADHGLPSGSLVVLIGASPVNRANTNLLKVHRLGTA